MHFQKSKALIPPSTDWGGGDYQVTCLHITNIWELLEHLMPGSTPRPITSASLGLASITIF